MVSVKFAVPALIAALAAAPGFAETAESAPSVAVYFGDLDLKTDSGVAALRGRIRRAAAQACGSFDARDLRRIVEVNDCRAVALSDAAPEIELAVAAAQRGGGYASSGASINVHSR